jgi:hypothetical protein
MRDVRDDLLATTDVGREWIDLFERVQKPLLGEVLSDRALTQEAMSLFERVQELLRKDKAIASVHDVKRGLAFLDKLVARTTSDSVRTDLSTVRKQLKKAEGKGVRKILAGLPRTRRRPVKKSPK